MTHWDAYWGERGVELAKLGLSVRAMNCCLNNGVVTIEALLAMTAEELLRWPNFGRATLVETEQVLARHGMAIASSPSRGDPLLAELIAKADVTRELLKEAGHAHKNAVAAINNRRSELGHFGT